MSLNLIEDLIILTTLFLLFFLLLSARLDLHARKSHFPVYQRRKTSTEDSVYLINLLATSFCCDDIFIFQEFAIYDPIHISVDKTQGLDSISDSASPFFSFNTCFFQISVER